MREYRCLRLSGNCGNATSHRAGTYYSTRERNKNLYVDNVATVLVVLYNLRNLLTIGGVSPATSRYSARRRESPCYPAKKSVRTLTSALYVHKPHARSLTLWTRCLMPPPIFSPTSFFRPHDGVQTRGSESTSAYVRVTHTSTHTHTHTHTRARAHTHKSER